MVVGTVSSEKKASVWSNPHQRTTSLAELDEAGMDRLI